jgi:hypothetical protein
MRFQSHATYCSALNLAASSEMTPNTQLSGEAVLARQLRRQLA